MAVSTATKGTAARALAAELRPTLALAGPVVLAELGWMAMGVADTMFVGRLPDGAEAIGAASLGNLAFFVPAVFGHGLLLGLDTLVAQAHGAGDRSDTLRSRAQGMILAVAVTPFIALAVLAMGPALDRVGIDPAVLRLTRPYLVVSTLGLLPLMVFSVLRRYLQALGRVSAIMAVLLAANAVNAAGNYALIFGHFGLPALGVVGSAWATVGARIFLMLGLVLAAAVYDRRDGVRFDPGRWRPDFARLRRLAALGLPAGTHALLEVGVFAAATALAGKFGAAPLAAHEVVLNVSSVTFMIPLGLASAGAVRVGHAVGRGEPPAAARAGWATLALGTSFMAASAAAFALAPHAILDAFTADPRVLAVGVPLLYAAAGFQLFDGVQGVTTGNLRGAGDTRTAMLSHALAHWVIGLPVGCLLAFTLGLGVLGLWLGLSLGLAVAAAILLYAWVVKCRDFRG